MPSGHSESTGMGVLNRRRPTPITSTSFQWRFKGRDAQNRESWVIQEDCLRPDSIRVFDSCHFNRPQGRVSTPISACGRRFGCLQICGGHDRGSFALFAEILIASKTPTASDRDIISPLVWCLHLVPHGRTPLCSTLS